MNRAVRLLSIFAVCSVAACTDGGERSESVHIRVFQAMPNAIEFGQSAKLMFAVDPRDAEVSITGVGNMTGQSEVTVSPTVTTVYRLTATSGEATETGDVTVTVGAPSGAGLKLEPASTTAIAGQPIAVTVSALASNGKTASSFRGTVHLSSSDASAALPGDIAFTAADAGVKRVMVTLKTAGLNTLTGTDKSAPGVTASATVTVGAAAAATCDATRAPKSVVAGSAIGLVVVIHDAFDNVANGYAGTIRVTATDLRASLPPDATYMPLDAGMHVFAAQLITTGVQNVIATDTTNPGLQCTTAIVVTPASPKLVIAAPAHVNAGYPVPIGVTVRDVFDNAIPSFAGTVSFASTDGAAGSAAPGPITFTGGEGGTATATATFMTPGPQMLSASDGGAPAAVGSAVSDVHGLVYTAPPTGRVRLVANTAQSNAQVVVLDLVANERLELSTFFGGGPGSFAAGMNLPLDTTRVTGDAPLLTAGNALAVGPTNPVAAAAIGGTDHVLYTAVSRKRVPGTIFTQVNEVQAGQVFYSVRLKLQPTSTVGPVFDGAQPSPLFRAAVRDQYGDDFVNLGDFGVGKLEVQ